MRKKLSLFFEEFFIESLISYYELLKEQIGSDTTNNNSSLGFIEGIVYTTFLRYMDKGLTIELVESARDNFSGNNKNREFLENLEKNTITPVFRERFGNNNNNTKFVDKIVKSGVDLFFECALVFSKGKSENLIDHICEL